MIRAVNYVVDCKLNFFVFCFRLVGVRYLLLDTQLFGAVLRILFGLVIFFQTGNVDMITLIKRKN